MRNCFKNKFFGTSNFKQVFERFFYKCLQYYYCPTKLKNFFIQRF